MGKMEAGSGSREASEKITRLLQLSASGTRGATEKLYSQVYERLRGVAKSYLRRQKNSHTLQPTALLHEAFLRLLQSGPLSAKDRIHFLATAAKAMRQALVDHARGASRKKRGGEARRITLSDKLAAPEKNQIDFLDLEEALEKLEALDPRQARIVEMKFFGGLEMDEIAKALEISKTTAESDWRMAKAWLNAQLSKD